MSGRVSSLSILSRHPRLTKYAFAVLGTAAALVWRLLMDPVLGSHAAYATFYIAVAASAILGGTGPGIIAALLGAVAADYYFLPPDDSIWVKGARNQLGFVLYLMVSAAFIVLARMQRGAKIRLDTESAARERAESHTHSLREEITEKERAEQALRASEARERARAAELEAIMQAVPAAAFVARDSECREIFGNRMSYDLLRLPPGSNVSQSAPEGSRPAVRLMKEAREIPLTELPLRKAAATGQSVRNFELEVLYEDGTSRSLFGDSVPLFDESGCPRGAVGAFVDITDRKRAEEHLRQAQKLESIGLLAGGIAHDFNNLLTAIMGNASMVLDELEPGPAELVKAVINSAERAADLTRQLLAYSGKGQFTVRDLDVSDAVNGMSNLLQSSLPNNVDFTLKLKTRLPAVRMDPGQLQQILMNLVINAGEAIGEGDPGKVIVATGTSDVAKPFVDAINNEVAPGRYVWIEVSDTGAGIDGDAIGKIFDPFFTTKFVGRGLGLAAVAGIARSQKGGITVQSEPGRGSTFRVLLPAAESRAQEHERKPDAAWRGTVLVVEDEASVRDFIAAALRRRGYRTLAASDGRNALDISGRERGRIDVAIVDVVMPVMGANDLLPLLKAEQPNMKILLTSGFSESEAKRLGAGYPDATFVQKPYTAQQIVKQVEELLGVPALEREES